MEALLKTANMEFKSIKEAEEFIIRTQIEVDDLTNKIADHIELGAITGTNIEWIKKAQAARRSKLASISIAKYWLNKASRKELNELYNLKKAIKGMLIKFSEIQSRITKERSARINIQEKISEDRRIFLRALYELTSDPVSTPTLDDILEWLPQKIATSPEWGIPNRKQHGIVNVETSIS